MILKNFDEFLFKNIDNGPIVIVGVKTTRDTKKRYDDRTTSLLQQLGKQL